MKNKKKIWVHEEKFNGKYFEGSYERNEYTDIPFNPLERLFVLTMVDGKRRITFESWQMAKQLGWIRLK